MPKNSKIMGGISLKIAKIGQKPSEFQRNRPKIAISMGGMGGGMGGVQNRPCPHQGRNEDPNFRVGKFLSKIF